MKTLEIVLLFIKKWLIWFRKDFNNKNKESVNM